MEKVRISTDYITLGQFLKLSNAVQNGGEAKIVIADGLVEVNGEIDTRRGRKLYENDVVSYNGDTYQVIK